MGSRAPSVMAGLPVKPAADQQKDMFGGGEPAHRRGRGRPKGAQNLQSREVRQWILSQHDNPLEGLVALALPADALQAVEKAKALADMAGMTVKEALQLMAYCSDKSNPYVNPRVPIPVEVSERRVVLNLGAVPDAAGGDAAGQSTLETWRRTMISRAVELDDGDAGATAEAVEAICEIIDKSDT